MACSHCKGFVPQKETDYSIEHYGKILCRPCQDNYETKEQIYQKNQKDKESEENKEKSKGSS